MVSWPSMSGSSVAHALAVRHAAASHLDTVPTPAPLVELDRLTDNVRSMAERARRAGVGLWPHVKTHKSLAVAGVQREMGAMGVTVATLAEAERFVDGGFHEVLVAYPPVGTWRLDRLAALAGRARVRVALDDASALYALDRACTRAGTRLGYLWELDCGARRLGTPPGPATADIIARRPRMRSVTFDGVFTFAGHAYAASGPAELKRIASAEAGAVLETAAALADRGIETPVLSVGTTPTCRWLEHEQGVTEARPGNYVFGDATQVALGVMEVDQCAFSVLATVVGRPDRRRLVLDAGSKALAAEVMSPLTSGYGLVVGHPDLRVERLFEEHAIVTSAEPVELPVGARVRVIPNHACAAVNLHEQLLVVQNSAAVDVWPVDARGGRP
jgi:D-serine deaminase-like pyridoxal phosphate-dependent protein